MSNREENHERVDDKHVEHSTNKKRLYFLPVNLDKMKVGTRYYFDHKNGSSLEGVFITRNLYSVVFENVFEHKPNGETYFVKSWTLSPEHITNITTTIIDVTSDDIRRKINELTAGKLKKTKRSNNRRRKTKRRHH